jgi:hydrogenase-4 component F
LLPGYRASSRVNACEFRHALAAFSLLSSVRSRTHFLVDDLNVVFIVLSTFVGFTTSVFSATYIAHELSDGSHRPI